jgi:hypothetical protein
MVSNLPPLRSVDAPTRDRILAEYRKVAIAFIGAEAPPGILDTFRFKPDEDAVAEVTEMQDALHKFLPALLPGVRLLIPFASTLIGVEVESPTFYRARFGLDGRRLNHEFVGARLDNLALAMLDDMWRRPRRCPLWACEGCGRVIVQPTRGRTVRFCGGSCKARGIPSASRRSEYVAQHRRRRRQHDLDSAVAAITGVAPAAQYAALRRTFRKPRRALLHLLRLAREEIARASAAEGATIRLP